MDGLPGTNIGQATMKSESITPLKKMVGPLAPTRYQNRNGSFGLEHMVLAVLLSSVVTAVLLLYGASIADALFFRLPMEAKSAFVNPIDKLC